MITASAHTCLRTLAAPAPMYVGCGIPTANRPAGEVNPNPIRDVFRPELGHTFKDIAQKVVVSRIDFE